MENEHPHDNEHTSFPLAMMKKKIVCSCKNNQKSNSLCEKRNRWYESGQLEK